MTMIPIGSFPLADPQYYEEHGYPHDYWTHAREHAPVARIENGPVPYWAVTRHADITAVGRQPELFLNRPRIMISAADVEGFDRPPTIIDMDPPEHGPYRRAISQRFTPRAVQEMREQVNRIAKNLIDKLTSQGPESEIDFVEALAAPLPIEVIGGLLGVPEAGDVPFAAKSREIGGS